ncbi:phosphoglucosamine mutase [Chloroflexota bacterium]
MKLFGSSGIRDIVNKEFLELTHDVGIAVGNIYRSVIVGHDTRTSSDAMKYAFISGLLSSGAVASDAGVVTTPTLAYASRKFEAGAMITASHNPPEYNGIKLINPDGSAFHSTQRAEIENILEAKSFKIASWEGMKSYASYPNAIEEHLERILTDFPTQLKLKVAVDCGGGTASSITPRLLSKLGCDVATLNCEFSGHPPRGNEPTPENLKALVRMVKDTRTDLGVAHDGDADRIAIVDDKGRFIPQDKLLAILASEMRAKKVVTTTDASMLLDEMGFEVARTKVGDAFVSEELGKGGQFGGESSGCFIFPSISLCPDAIYAAAIIARIASADRISALVDQIPSYPVLRGSVAGDRAIMAQLEELLKKESSLFDTTDGLKIYFSNGWLLIRSSGTEPKIRITAEAKSEQRVNELYDLGIKTIKECLKEQERAIT